MTRRAQSSQPPGEFRQGRAPAPQHYYDLGESSIIAWQSGRDAGDARRFYTLRDLAPRLERETAIRPALFIFHCGRCGSTLLARLLALDPANRVFFEPRALSQFLHANHRRLDAPAVLHDLRVLLLAYGLEPNRDEKRFIIKLNSLAVHALPAIRAVLPEVDFLYLLRDPADVIASLSRAAPAFLQSDRRASLAELIGCDPTAAAADPAGRWWSRYLEWNLNLAYAHAREFTAAVDYRDYATRYLALAQRWSNRQLAAADSQVIDTLAFHSKRPGVPFVAIASAVGSAVPADAVAAYSRWRRLAGDAAMGSPAEER